MVYEAAGAGEDGKRRTGGLARGVALDVLCDLGDALCHLAGPL
jgi:hypothetical protein